LILSIRSGVSDSETSVAILSPTLRSVLPTSASPIFSTVPSSMPPDPVTGLRCLPCFSTMSSMISAILALSPPAWFEIWVKLAESMLRVCTSIRISLS